MRAVIVAAAVAFVISLFITPVAIRVFTALKAGQPIRSIGPATHLTKTGTPTMGGVAFIIATVLAYVAGHIALISLPERQIAQEGPTMTAFVLLGLFVCCGAVGFLDDLLKVRRRNSDGLSAKGKLLGQAVVGTGFGIAALYVASTNGQTVASEHISFIRDISWLDVGKVGSVMMFVFVITAMSNGVNLTDGLDGLATGASVLVFGAYSLIGFWQYRHWCADTAYARANEYCYEVRDPLEISMIAAAAAAACVGFLWWNTSPARIFMGDVGSLALGALIGGLAVATRTTLLSIIIGGLFVLITVTWVIQIVSFRTTGRRVFRMVPLHHHFELAGWSEVNIVVRFWIIAGVSVAVGLGLFYSEFLAANG
ncbi:phospho-N-acetylmuramoyl-pentapeptide-transferase [Actinoplanes bogorensis]|uniref:Phospho-N-acetylmuramoyl-pentapeptide-transferase n=1 Tax=Paractinoplanes bogorensis TaxID=1610840 RepID=A0ABS5Z3U8_9ACTN|nr:phospho-N-acetylmuramoyl-pentapeptide-transferase [Actinoplanes bogorensis]MBU2669090.1 phospho-N-acetylmuramoyl-pentapeptide-transferase [Actinoplanes bogorensis]